MTFVPAKLVIANLREKIKKLKDQLDAVKAWLEIVYIGNESQASPEDLRQLKELLEDKK